MSFILLQQKEVRVYTILTSLVICGLAGSLITAPKITHIGINFPFSNIVFSLLTYPIVDCICELWGKKVAQQTLWLGISSQILIMLIIQLSILAPHATFWQLQPAYEAVLATGFAVAIANFTAFTISQMMDIVVYQHIKELSQGKWLWLRSNLSTYLGQSIDSCIFVLIVFHASNHKWNILLGSIVVKMMLSFCMTPIIYMIVISANNYLDSKTLAFCKNE